MPIQRQGKQDQIRDLLSQGVSAAEIVRRGFPKSTVYSLIAPDRRAYRSIRSMLHDILSTQDEILRVVRKLAKEETNPIDRALRK